MQARKMVREGTEERKKREMMERETPDTAGRRGPWREPRQGWGVNVASKAKG